ncbi:membrane protein [Microbacterium phage Gilda]|uniref:Holin n=6 Tax=Krampusvirus krampus TaxID=2734242 RepID=A0A2Z4Q3J5_9CAUD|nr:holin [Microbacterium phage Krampus]AWY04494.1 holin [Microbacterium phage AnnaSerena]QCQ57400.1 membrane protein [Microbacterium phage Rachella]QDF18090.1 holin [Microbacterium phage Anakin]QDF18172.1 holin [Microbacterium phage NarutoRun]QOC58697.1 membrane protein [Microbacterium phage Gilda]UDG78658.1 membrane protein [Microbacterium phage Neptune]UDL15517.1 holin [Microbacterium phage Cybele]WIC90105.1 membrane protein [Microbacterium phage Tedro]WNT45032.1 holin [Microbacterium ph
MNLILASNVLAASNGDQAVAIEFNLPPALIIGLIVSTVLPILVGLVTTRVTNSSVKAVVLAALAAVTGLLTELLASINAGTAYDLGNGLVFALTAFLVAVAMHFGLWKPTTVSEKAQNVLVTSKGEDGTYRAN